MVQFPALRSSQFHVEVQIFHNLSNLSLAIIYPSVKNVGPQDFDHKLKTENPLAAKAPPTNNSEMKAPNSSSGKHQFGFCDFLCASPSPVYQHKGKEKKKEKAITITRNLFFLCTIKMTSSRYSRHTH